MRIGDVFIKDPNDWTLADKQMLRLEMNRLQSQVSTMSKWIGPGGNLDVQYLRAATAEIEMFVPVNYARLSRFGAVQSIPNNTETPIEWNSSDLPTGNLITWSAGTPENICLSHHFYGKRYKYAGYVQFASNATGWRGVYLNAYDIDNNLLGGQTLAQDQRVNGVGNVVAFYTEFKLTQKTATHMELTCKQTSGGALNVDYARIHISQVG